MALIGNEEDVDPEGFADDEELPVFDDDGNGGGLSLGSCGLTVDNGFGAMIIPGGG